MSNQQWHIEGPVDGAEIGEPDRQWIAIQDQDGAEVCVIMCRKPHDFRGHNWQDAKLIAEAPAMMEALEALVAGIEDPTSFAGAHPQSMMADVFAAVRMTNVYRNAAAIIQRVRGES